MDCRARKVRYAAADGFHDLAFTHWGAATLKQRALCVHGLTRNGRDFDALARHLVLHGWQVACPDLPGRGASDRLHDPALYALPTYVTALSHLLAVLDWADCAWVGTSLGGILGMAVAGMPGSPVRRLVLNDIGAHVPQAALAHIRDYLALPHRFADLVGLEARLRQVHEGFGPLSDAEWRCMAEHSAVRLPDGGVAMHYDPAIAVAFAQVAEAPIDLGPMWSRVACPTLILRGARSDLLTEETARAMAARPGVELETIPDCGHAPALLSFDQVSRVAAFLDG
jgi:pimeloyl-ACP methyl ester carboxylesterase